MLCLNGKWKLKYFGKNNIPDNFYSSEYNDMDWINASVPGDVHLDLIREGIIEEPLYDTNAQKCRWIEDKVFIYRKKFYIEKGFIKDKIELVFEGIDTWAEIWLNEKKIGFSKNAFIEKRFDITGILKEGENVISVKVTPGLELAKGKPLEKYACKWYEDEKLLNERIWIRKPQFSFKWHWAPRLLTCGIWRSVYIKSNKIAVIKDIFIKSKLKSSSADINIEIEVDNLIEGNYDVQMIISVKGKNNFNFKKVRNITLKPGLNKLKENISIKNPALWFPYGTGEQNLYNFNFKISKNEEIVDEYNVRTGIREVKLLQEKLPLPEGGKSFVFMVNNKKVFCKGANWIPADSILARVNGEKYRTLIELAQRANFNMLRVWGGGIYEDKNFYRLCDECGIMIWQDFMFACGLYPDDDKEFLENVKEEAIWAVKKLRNHPSIVLWCGNNENEWHYDPAPDNLFKGAERFFGDKIYEKLLPEICNEYDGTRPYWQSSPFGGKNPNSEDEGDHHFYYISSYGGGHVDGTEYECIKRVCPKFISEYGFSAFPSKKSFLKAIPEDQLYEGSKSLDFHTFKSSNSFFNYIRKKVKHYLLDNPENLSFNDLIICSQFLQGEAFKYSIEHFRRRKYKTGGILFWMFNDCWLAHDGSIVDYYLDLKPGYYYVKRAYAPVLISIKEEDYGVSVWVINDTGKSYNATLICSLCYLEGGVIKSVEKKVKIKPDSSEILLYDRVEGFGKNVFYYVCLKDKNNLISENRYFFVKFKELILPEPEIKYEVTSKKDRTYIELYSDKYSLMTWIELPDGLMPDDNYFDLYPKKRKLIRIDGSLSKGKIKINSFSEKYIKFNKR